MADALATGRGQRWSGYLRQLGERAQHSRGLQVQGILNRMVGMTLEATGCEAAVGGRCLVRASNGAEVETEVVGFTNDRLLLMPTTELHSMMPGARVIPSREVFHAKVGEAVLGRLLDGAGRPIDDKGPVECEDRIQLAGVPMNPLLRTPISKPLDVGVRSINGLLTVGRGQRLGLFAGTGVGKSMLLGMMTRYTEADVIVVGLIGERGREVREFVQDVLGSESSQRAVVVATPADHPPLVRLHGAMLATSIAEYFRDRGCHVLLLMDSLTRFAQAQREVGLAVGEPPVTKGYPASVFARLPQLVERAGNGTNPNGSITAFYTVLTESDDPNDPVADAAKAVLDGHLVLSRALAESGLYPALDLEASVSRSMQAVTSDEHRQLIKRFRHLNAIYQQNRDLITVGAYAAGSDPRVDEAIEYWPHILDFLQQEASEPVSLQQSIDALANLFASEHRDDQ
jgi:flagellum-specific ATP synthase